MELALFIFFSLVAVSAACAVILFQNPIKSALALVTTLLCLAFVFVLLQAHFVAVIQILLYSGAVMVLFLFVVMFSNLEDKSSERLRFSPARILTAMLGMVLLATLSGLMLGGADHDLAAPLPDSESLESWSGGTVSLLGEHLMSDFLLPFEIISLLLLVAIIGAVVITRQRRSAS